MIAAQNEDRDYREFEIRSTNQYPRKTNPAKGFKRKCNCSKKREIQKNKVVGSLVMVLHMKWSL